MIFQDEEEYLVLIRAKACRVKAQTIVGVMKSISCVTSVGIWGVDGKSIALFEGNKSCNFYMTISWLNSMSPVGLKNSLIVFFLNACEQIVVIQAKNSSFENS